jgi:hypothetical protein
MAYLDLPRESVIGPQKPVRKPERSSAVEEPGAEFRLVYEDPGGRFEDPGDVHDDPGKEEREKREEEEKEEEEGEEEGKEDDETSDNEEECGGSDIDIEGQYRIDRDVDDVTASIRRNGCETLNCETNRLHRSGVQQIAHAIRHSSSRPSEIKLADNPLGPGGGVAISRHIAAFRGAHEINLQECGLEDQGVAAIVGNARQLGNLHDLNLEENGMGDDGLAALARQGTYFHALNTLNISKNDFGHEGFSALVNAVEHGGFSGLHEITVGTGQVDEEEIARLRSHGVGVKMESNVY